MNDGFSWICTDFSSGTSKSSQCIDVGLSDYPSPRGPIAWNLERDWNVVTNFAKSQKSPWRIHGAAISGAPWIPSIYPIYVSIYSSTMDPSWDMERDSEIHGLMNHGFDEHPRFVHSSRAANHVPRQTSRVYDLGSPKLTPTGHIQKERPAT
jgi:hypothetical protein